MVPEQPDLKGTVFSPTELVSYQDGNVVSRMLTYTPQGTVTIFAFSAGSGLSEHSAPYDALLQILEGTAVISLSGKEHQVSEGQMIILPAERPHAVRAETAFKMILTMIHA